MKILLGNDTGTAPHLGCQAVSDGHARLLGRAGHEVVHRLFRGELARHEAVDEAQLVRNLERDERVAEMLEAVEAVVVNAEGTIHHGAGRSWLALLELAQRRGKATLLVNAVYQQMPGFEATLARLDDFTVRESRSLAEARARGGRPRLVPDSYLAARFSDGGDPFTGDVVTDWHRQRADSGDVLQRYLVERSATFAPLVTPEAMAGWASFPARLGGADCLLTARHHGVCAAIVAGTPFVALGSNTHKIEAMLQDLEVPFLVVESFADLQKMRDWAVSRRDLFRSLLERLTGGGPLTTFASLGTTGEDRENQEVARLAEHLRVVQRAT